MSYANILITGASRGIGLEMVKQYAAMASTKLLFATCRNESKAPELKQVAANSAGRVKILELEVRDYDKYESIVAEVTKEVGSDGLNLLINNAGIHIKADFHDAKRDDMMEVYEVNVVAPLLLTRALTPLLQASSRAGHKTFVANISSKVGSIADNTSGQMYAYRTSKAAFNQVSKSLSIQLAADNIIVAPIHPGWVQTDMGGPNAPIDTKTSVENMVRTFENIKPEQAGLLLNYDGTVIPY
jgi:NAD(P)-dependent dehydrogenase (short-subunit alcohol dehydrogenase family)